MRILILLYAIFLPPFSTEFGHATSPVRMIPVPRGKLCVTEGAIEEQKGAVLAVTGPKMRAFVGVITRSVVEARLTYLGPSSTNAPLDSGTMRRQFALKLRAQDGCNLIYAAWRIEPDPRLVISIKRNPGMHASVECGNRGYRDIKPIHSSSIPRLRPGNSHSLLAHMDGSEMRVSIDGKVVWEGDLGPEALAFDGPVGVRTDNGRFEFELLTPKLGEALPCRREGTNDDE